MKICLNINNLMLVRNKQSSVSKVTSIMYFKNHLKDKRELLLPIPRQYDPL